jgi:hypothetical protein
VERHRERAVAGGARDGQRAVQRRRSLAVALGQQQDLTEAPPELEALAQHRVVELGELAGRVVEELL